MKGMPRYREKKATREKRENTPLRGVDSIVQDRGNASVEIKRSVFYLSVSYLLK